VTALSSVTCSFLLLEHCDCVCVCVFFFCVFWKFIYCSVRNSDPTKSKKWMIVNNVLVRARKKPSFPILINYLDICLKRVFSQPIFKRHLLNKIQERYCVGSIAGCLFWEFCRNINVLYGQNAELALVVILQQPVCLFKRQLLICSAFGHLCYPSALGGTLVSEIL
jgi:hypothetical protein